jgi:hypothetical protein
MKKKFLFIAALLIIATSCNKIDTSKEVFQIIGQVTVSPWDPEYAKTVIQKIYVEEFTGHRCTYCPAGAKILKTLMEEDSTIIVTAIHCTTLADPVAFPFDKDYKTPMGDIICKDFRIADLPKATINRMEISSNVWGIDRNKWRSAIAAIDRNNVRAGIELQCKVDETIKEIEATVSVTITKDLPHPVQLCLVLQQDSIISGQIDGTNIITGYVHNHVLLAGLNGNYGIKLTPNGMVNAQNKYTTTFKLSYGNSFPNSYFPVVINNCCLVAYLINAETKEVLQVECVYLSGSVIYFTKQ